jgi:hypothetical protein
MLNFGVRNEEILVFSSENRELFGCMGELPFNKLEFFTLIR